MSSTFVAISFLLATGPATYAQSPPATSQQWQVYAGCAAAYQANWQHRLTDPNRTHDMSTMIHEQSEDYKKVAIGFYESEKKTSPDDANKNVATYVDANVEGFLAMDAAGTLEAYLDQCPQLEVR
jgi:hypothetical protein